MPALQSISLNDRETTPVAHAFVVNGKPRDGVGRVVRLAASGLTAGAEALTISYRESGGKSRSKIVLNVPVVVTETINGVSKPSVIRTAIAEVNFTFDQYSTTQERKNLVGMVQDMLNTSKTLVNDTVINSEYVW